MPAAGIAGSVNSVHGGACTRECLGTTPCCGRIPSATPPLLLVISLREPENWLRPRARCSRMGWLVGQEAHAPPQLPECLVAA